MYDLIVVGGGPAGLMAAGTASSRGLKTLLVERNEKIGRKLMITGKGRCNVTNDCRDINDLVKNVPVNGKFLFGAFSRFKPEDTMSFFENNGVKLKVERGNRVFPESDQASDIVDSLRRFVLHNGVQIKNARVKDIIHDDNIVKGVKTFDDEVVFADNVIIATGGASYPKTGSTGDGYDISRKIGHTVTDIKPSLVPLVIHEGWCSEAMGLSLRNTAIMVEDTAKNKIIYKDFGEMLFTHFGVSGPMILSASSHLRNMEPNRYKIHIDLKPALDNEQLDKRILREFNDNPNKNFINILDLLLPKKIVPIIGRLSGIKLSAKVNQITKAERDNLVLLMKDLTITVKSFRPIDEAIITSGGISVKEINPKTMESKIIKNLFFCGEIIDVDAYTGGFNLQIAFSTGKLAGESVNKI